MAWSSGFNPDVRLMADNNKPTTITYETTPFLWGGGNVAGLVSGTLSLAPIWLPAGHVVTSMSAMAGTAAPSGITHRMFGMYDTSLNLIRQSIDVLATDGWSASTLKLAALDSIPVTAGARVASTTVTLTIPTLKESLTSLIAVNDSVVVSNANIAAYNGTFTVTGVSATTITYTAGSSATDNLAAPFPTVQLAAGKRTYTVLATAHYYLGIMQVHSAGAVNSLQTVPFMNATAIQAMPVFPGTSTASLTGTLPSPAGAITATGAYFYGGTA